MSGARGGHTGDFRQLAHQGVTLVGQTRGFDGARALFPPDLAENIRRGDASYLALLDAADNWVARNGSDLPEEPSAREFLPDPACVSDPLLSLDLAEAGIGAIIWATGYTTDYRWRSTPSMTRSGRSITAACRRSRGSIFSACRGCRGAGPPLSGASGTMPNILPTRSPFSASISVTSRPDNRFLKECFDANSYPYSHV